ncbi:hypothetical protein V3C99_010804 [Haemonchus contortus]
MSDELPEDIRRIITAQTERKLPTTVTLPVLPKIGQPFSKTDTVSGQSSSASLRNSSLDMGTSGHVVKPSITPQMKRSSATKQHRPDQIIQFDYSHIPNHELLSSTESTSNADAGRRASINALTTELDRTFVIRRAEPLLALPSDDSISVLDLTLAPIPATLPVIPGLQTAIDNLSERRVQSILDACMLYDREQRGYLSAPSMIKCIGEVVTSVHSSDSPWRLLLNSMAPRGEFIEYKRLFALIQKTRQPEFSEETIPELLTPLNNDDGQFTFKSSTSQENRQICRAQVMKEIEVMLMRNPELSLDRLRTATTHKVIELCEFNMLLEMYGLEEAFRPFHQRLVSCFLTHDNKIHFSAFVGCLALVRPPIRQSAPAAPTAPWNKAPLGPITAKRKTSKHGSGQ